MSDSISSVISNPLNTDVAGIHHPHQLAQPGSYGAIKSYLIGFLLSVVLTGVPFGIVMTGILPRSATLASVVAMAVLQIVVHLKYFLHLDFSGEGKVNTFAFLFTALIIVMVVGLSIWIIYSANALMM